MKCFGGSEKRRNFHCKVVLLDETELIQEIQDSSKGQDLLDVVFKHLNLLETAYFGLRFIDTNGQARWLDSNKSVIKQMKDVNPMTLYFGVKFYAADPCKLLEEITRYQFFLQLKQDILQARLPVSPDLMAELFAHAVQSELGDYDPRRHQDGYVSEFRFVPNQTNDLEKKVGELHKGLAGQVPATAEMNFLERVKWLDLYGADLHPVLGEDNIEYFLGLTPSGVIVLRNKSKVGNYFWPRIVKVYRKGKYFMIRALEKSNEQNTYGFELPNKQSCKHLWKCCTEYQAFFKLTQSKDSCNNYGKKLAGFTQRFRYSGRQGSSSKCSGINPGEPESRGRNGPSIVRVPSRRYERRLGQPDGADATTSNKEEAYKENGYIEVRSSIVIPPGRHVTQPIIYRSTSVPSALPITDSPKSTKSVPWENPKQKGLFSSSTNPSPRSVRSAFVSHNVRSSSIDSNHKHRDCASTSSRFRSSRTSDNESEVSKCSKSSRHSRHSSKSSSSHHHRCRHRRHNDDSGTESDSSRRRHRRRHKCINNNITKLIDSEHQWNEIQRRQRERNEQLMDGPRQAVVHHTTLKDLSSGHKYLSGYTNSGMESESEVVNNNNNNNNNNSSSTLNRTKRKQRSRSKSPETLRRDSVPQEVKKHIEYRLIEPTDEDKRNIRYTRVETDSKLFKIRYSPNSGKARCKLDEAKSNGYDGNCHNGHYLPPPSLYNASRGALRSMDQQYILAGHHKSQDSNASATSSQSSNGRVMASRGSPQVQPNLNSQINGNHYQSDSNNSSTDNQPHRPNIMNRSSMVGLSNRYANNEKYDYLDNIKTYEPQNANLLSNKFPNANGHGGFGSGSNHQLLSSPRVTFQTPPSTTAYYTAEVPLLCLLYAPHSKVPLLSFFPPQEQCHHFLQQLPYEE